MVNVIGLGYIGLPTALMLSSHGIEVVGTDVNADLVQCLNNRTLMFQENGMNELYQNAVSKGIMFSTEYCDAEIYIVSVPTPYDKVSKKIDTKYVVQAVEKIMTVCRQESIIVIESTVSPGTIDKSVRPIIEKNRQKIGYDIHLAHAPERIIPGNMIRELLHNNRTIGVDDAGIGEKVRYLYESFCEGEIVITDIRTAEMTKVVENTFRAVNIAFANELAKICREDNMDVHEIIKICNMHPRVNILQPGPGVGGHCIPVDPWFLVGDYPHLTNVIHESMRINENMPYYVLDRICEIMKAHDIKDLSRVGLYGLSYKEDVDDYRESPTIQLLEVKDRLFKGNVKVYDPFICEDITPNQYHDFESFLQGIDLIVIMVSHTQIIDNLNKLKTKIVFDTRKCCDLPGTYYL